MVSGAVVSSLISRNTANKKTWANSLDSCHRIFYLREEGDFLKDLDFTIPL